MTKRLWIVDVKGENKGPGCESDFEISVLPTTNTHGISSWGWMGKDKLCIIDSGNCREGVHSFVWDRHIQTAFLLRNMLNSGATKP